MRVHSLVLLVACGLYLGAMDVTAQAEGTKADADRGGARADTGAKSDTRDAGTAARADDVIGLSVRNTAGESLGKIEDLVIDPATGKIRYAVLSFGGMLGIGDKYFAVPWDQLSFVTKGETMAGTAKEERCILDVSKETLKNAPSFDKRNWPNFADPNWTSTVDKHYGSQGR